MECFTSRVDFHHVSLSRWKENPSSEGLGQQAEDSQYWVYQCCWLWVCTMDFCVHEVNFRIHAPSSWHMTSLKVCSLAELLLILEDSSSFSLFYTCCSRISQGTSCLFVLACIPVSHGPDSVNRGFLSLGSCSGACSGLWTSSCTCYAACSLSLILRGSSVPKWILKVFTWKRQVLIVFPCPCIHCFMCGAWIWQFLFWSSEKILLFLQWYYYNIIKLLLKVIPNCHFSLPSVPYGEEYIVICIL